MVHEKFDVYRVSLAAAGCIGRVLRQAQGIRRGMQVAAMGLLLMLTPGTAQCGECMSFLTYKLWEPECMVGESARMFIVPVPINVHYADKTAPRIQEINRPFLVPTVDLEEKYSDGNPLSNFSVRVNLEPDPQCPDVRG